MATLIINNAYLVSIRAESGGRKVTNVIGVNAEFSSVSEVANAVKTEWLKAGGPLALHPSQYTMLGITVTDLSTADGDVFDLSVVGTGGIAAAALATNGSCAIISYGGGSRSRSGNGRMYHGPLTETQVNSDGRTVATATITALTAAYTQFNTNLKTAGFDWVVISRKLAKTTQVGTIQTQSVLGTQRRRIR